MAAKCLPSVVSITAQGETEDSGGIGSGVILDTDGNILTNYHVIEGASALVVRTDSGDSYEAEVVGTDESSDLAVVRLQDADRTSISRPLRSPIPTTLRGRVGYGHRQPLWQ